MSAAALPTAHPDIADDPLAERINPLTLTGSQFLGWVRDHLRDESHRLRQSELSAKARLMAVDHTRLEVSDAFAAAEEAIGALIAAGDTPANRRIIGAMRAAVLNERAARGASLR